MSIFLEEAGLAYQIFPVSLSKGEQFAPDLLKIALNNRIPDPRRGTGGRRGADLSSDPAAWKNAGFFAGGANIS